ncbi:MAG: hypothetical protein JWM43_3807 [Acidobacteriaceae bacterium]|nr:hypothetical protein [Acidobacteriaceae bacterium]
MKIRRLQTLTLVVAIVASLPVTYALAQNDSGAKQSIKNAGTETKNAAKDTGHGIKQGTKKAYHKTKNGTKKAARKVEGKPTQTTSPQ